MCEELTNSIIRTYCIILECAIETPQKMMWFKPKVLKHGLFPFSFPFNVLKVGAKSYLVSFE
jgi:hypothetical protein